MVQEHLGHQAEEIGHGLPGLEIRLIVASGALVALVRQVSFVSFLILAGPQQQRSQRREALHQGLVVGIHQCVHQVGATGKQFGAPPGSLRQNDCAGSVICQSSSAHRNQAAN